MTKQTSRSSSTPSRVVLVGAGGLIGRSILERLQTQGQQDDVVRLSRSTRPRLDLEDPASIEQALAALAPFDHVIVAAGEAHFAPLPELRESSFTLGLRSKLMGQVRVALAALPHLRPGGSITLTSGALSHAPARGSTPAALVNGAIDAFVRGVAFELQDGRRINAVSPSWITETLLRFDMDPQQGTSATEVAELYLHALRSELHGSVIARIPDA